MTVPPPPNDAAHQAEMDRVAAEYLASESPDPTQASIDAVLAAVTRVRVFPLADPQQTLLDTSAPESLTAFRACFAIVEDPQSFGHCMCPGDPHVELYAGERLVATFGYHHGFALRWNAWKHDALFQQPEQLLEWFTAHGVDGPRQEVEAVQKQMEEGRRSAERWLSAMPPAFRRFRETMQNDWSAEVRRAMLTAFATAIPTEDEQTRTLCEWFGAGHGPWSNFPSYENLPNLLLLEFSTASMITALATANERQTLGAARYFASYHFRQNKKEDRDLLPAELKQQLLAAVRATGITDNIVRAERSYGD